MATRRDALVEELRELPREERRRIAEELAPPDRTCVSLRATLLLAALVVGVGGVGAARRRPAACDATMRRYPHHSAFDPPRDALLRLRRGAWSNATSSHPLLLGVGHGKTATKSLNKALTMIGLRTAHFYGAGIYGLLRDNVAEVGGHPFALSVGDARHVDAVLDTPVVDFYHELLLAYPNARVILTVRDARSWLRSQQKFYARFARGCRRWLAPWRRGSNLVYGTECPSPEQALKRYLTHNRNVVDAVPPDRLLVMDIAAGDGWNKLCPFLGLERHACPPTNVSRCRLAGVADCRFPSRK